jgi:hypothetical protein
MRTELGLLKRTVLPATNTVGALQQIQTEISSLILPNLAHLLILCVFTSVLCGVNKEVKENNNNKKPNPIFAFYIQTRGAQTTI